MNNNLKRKELKLLAVKYKGGGCYICGYNKCIEALEFHHLDSNKKEFSISTVSINYSWDKVIQELDKCVLLCANCHREQHFLRVKYEYSNASKV